MDKRTILALVLSAIVILLFQVIYFAPAERRAQEQRRIELEQVARDSLIAAQNELGNAPAGGTAPASITSGVTSAGDSARPVTGGLTSEAGAGAVRVGGILGGLPSVSGVRAQDIKVETDLYEATFSSKGGVLTSMRLKAFKVSGDSLVDLVRAGGEGKGELELVIASEKGAVSLSAVHFSVTDSVDENTGAVRKLTFLAEDGSGLSVSRVYRFSEGSYAISLDTELHGVSSQSEKLECLLGWTDGLSLTETNVREDIRSMATVSLLGTEMFRDDLGSYKKTPRKEHTGNVIWTGVRSRYFIAAFIPPEGTVTKVVSFGYPDRNVSASQLVIPVSASGVTRSSCTVYLGPIDLWELKEMNVGLERVVNLGWSWIRPVSQGVLWFLVKCHTFIPNYGLVIIILSALTKILFHPLTRSSMRSMREMQKLQPEIQKLREKFKKEPQRLNKEVMGLYKKEKINPLGGCLPLLLQMPVFIALYNVLMSSIEMRRAHFVWWISDLSSPDTVAVVGGLAIHLLPLLMAATMFWQQKMTPTDPRQAAMTYFMPILMLVFFYGLPSGLVLYWTANNGMTIAQQYISQRGDKRKAALDAEMGSGAVPAARPAG